MNYKLLVIVLSLILISGCSENIQGKIDGMFGLDVEEPNFIQEVKEPLIKPLIPNNITLPSRTLKLNNPNMESNQTLKVNPIVTVLEAQGVETNAPITGLVIREVKSENPPIIVNPPIVRDPIIGLPYDPNYTAPIGNDTETVNDTNYTNREYYLM
jgi:hypothetical protein